MLQQKCIFMWIILNWQSWEAHAWKDGEIVIDTGGKEPKGSWEEEMES